MGNIDGRTAADLSRRHWQVRLGSIASVACRASRSGVPLRSEHLCAAVWTSHTGQKWASNGLCDDEGVPLICPTCQVLAQSVPAGDRLLLCMGLFSIFLVGSQSDTTPSRCFVFLRRFRGIRLLHIWTGSRPYAQRRFVCVQAGQIASLDAVSRHRSDPLNGGAPQPFAEPRRRSSAMLLAAFR